MLSPDCPEEKTSLLNDMEEDFPPELPEEDEEYRWTMCPSLLGSLVCIISAINFPLMLFWCKTVEEKHQVVALEFGKYKGTLKTPGFHCVNPILKLRSVSVKQKTLHLTEQYVLDVHGNPLVVSGVVTYQVCNARKALLDVDNCVAFVRNNALACMKATCAAYPYRVGPAQHYRHSLSGQTKIIQAILRAKLQKRATIAGVEIKGFDLTDLNYAPEISRQMLVRQHAEALIEARKRIVENAVKMSLETEAELESQRHQYTQAERNRLLSNLLLQICGETRIAFMYPT